MPRRRGKFIPLPSHLSRVLEHLNTGPRLALNGLRRISLTYAARNDHMGARCLSISSPLQKTRPDTSTQRRHFVKDELPRIRWANPLLEIAVNRVPKTRQEAWAPQATVEFGQSLLARSFSVLFTPCFRGRVDVDDRFGSQVVDDDCQGAHGSRGWRAVEGVQGLCARRWPSGLARRGKGTARAGEHAAQDDCDKDVVLGGDGGAGAGDVECTESAKDGRCRYSAMIMFASLSCSGMIYIYC